MTEQPRIVTHEPAQVAVAYTDDGLLLCWPTDPANPNWLHLPLGDQVDTGIGVLGALLDCDSAHERDLGKIAVGSTPDGRKVAVMWLDSSGQINALLVPHAVAPVLAEQMQRAVDDRDVLIRHDFDVQDADPDDFA